MMIRCLSVASLLCCALLAGCQAQPSAGPAPHPVFTNEVDRGFSQIFGSKPVDITLDSGKTLYGCTFMGYTNFRDKDFLRFKDATGADYMIPSGHIVAVKR